MPKSVYKDDNIEHIESDVEKIRVKTEMYISYRGSKGALHIGKEVVNNGIDECLNDKSPADTVTVFFKENENQLVVEDNGRGIPFDKVREISEYLQSGSKFDGGKGAGENGVGLTAVNALSHSLTYVIYRVTENGSYRGTFTFSEGKFINQEIVKVSGKRHGTIVSYIPSKDVLGKCPIDAEELEAWVNMTSYVIDKKITLKFAVQKKGKEIEKFKVYKHENGFVDYIDTMTKNKLVAPVSVDGSIDDVDVHCVFTYDHKDVNGEEKVDSFANTIHTPDGGVHVKAAKAAITFYLSKMANAELTDAERKKFMISAEDCRNGLVMAVNMSCNNPGFTGQTKEKVGADEVFRPVRDVVARGLNKYFRKNPKDLQKICGYLKKIAKSRLEITKIRKSDVSGYDSFAAAKMKNFSPAYGTGYQELFLCEGLSAKGCVNKARDPKFQASFAFRGVLKNTVKGSLKDIIGNTELLAFLNISGFAASLKKYHNLKHVTPKDSVYSKYIISTDSDIDGYNITSGISVFFLVNLRPIVEAGMLYKSMAPLYKVVTGKGEYKYVVSKMEYFDMCVDNLVKETNITHIGGKKMKRSELHEFYVKNKTYLDTLRRAYGYCYTAPDIIEFVVRYFGEKDFVKKLRARFPEIDYADGTLKGIYNKTFQYLDIDKRFIRATERLREQIFDVNGGEIYFDFEEPKGKSENVSIGDILVAAGKYSPTIKDRWKGLGGIAGGIFWETVLNPEKRVLTQLTVSDIEKDLEAMRIIHGDDPQLRRDLLEGYVLDKDDIDN